MTTTRGLNPLFNHEHGSLAANSWDADSSSATVILKLCCPSLLRIDRDGALRDRLRMPAAEDRQGIFPACQQADAAGAEKTR